MRLRNRVAVATTEKIFPLQKFKATRSFYRCLVLYFQCYSLAPELQRTLFQLSLLQVRKQQASAAECLAQDSTASKGKYGRGAQLKFPTTTPVTSLRQGFRIQKQHKDIGIIGDKDNWRCPQPSRYWSVSISCGCPFLALIT